MLQLPSGDPVEMIGPLELRVAELMHHMKIESAVAEGAKNVVRQLSGRKFQDRRILAEVGTSWIVLTTTGISCDLGSDHLCAYKVETSLLQLIRVLVVVDL